MTQSLSPLPPRQSDLEDITDLIEMREEVSSLVIGAMKVAEEYQDSFERYSYLWVDDLQEFMKNFLIFGHAPTPEELDTKTDDTIPKTPPTLAQFQQQVCMVLLSSCVTSHILG
jgi:dynein heavy chain